MFIGFVKVLSSAPLAPDAGPARITYGVRFTSLEVEGSVTKPAHCPFPVAFNTTSFSPTVTATTKSSSRGRLSKVFSKRTVPETET